MIGVNLSGAEFGAVPGRYGYDYIYPSQSDLSYYANAGVQIVRLPVRWERLQPTVGGALDTAELGRLSTFLDNAANTGIKVIIDLHNFGADFGNKLGTSGASNADFADFWQKLSTAIGNKTAVAGYDLMNEPNNLGDATEWPAAAQAAIDAIRAVDNTHSIYVEGDNWASALNWSANNANLNLSDPSNKLIYEAHLYFDKYSTGTYQGTYDSEGATANMAAAELQDFSNWLTAHNAKGFIGEFAVPDNDPRWLTVLDNMLTAMHADGLDGTYWGAGPWWGNYPLALRAADGSANPQLAVLERHIQLEASSSTDGASLAVAHIAMPSDFNGDGNSDVLWRNDNGGLAVWDVHTSIPNENAYINSVSTSWHIAETFDMNGDGHSDILWRNDSGALSVWTGGASGFQQAAYNASVGADWHIAGTGDINGDGLSDIIFQRNDGAVAGWTSTGPSFNQSAYYHAPVGGGWSIEGLGDFNGDGKADILWHNASGAVSIWSAGGASGFVENAFLDNSVSRDWSIVGIADFNGDGKDDILWRNSSGAISEWTSTGSGFTKNTYFNANVGTTWTVAATGDYNGDGKADILWHSSSGAIAIWDSTATGFDQTSFYNAGAATSWHVADHIFA